MAVTNDQVTEDIQFLMESGYIDDYASEYGEPGYRLSNESGFVALGDIWCRNRECDYSEAYDDGTKKVHSVEFHYPELFERLEEAGMEFEWHDEWIIIDDKAWRTSADSYQWQSSILYTDGDYLTPDDGIEEWVEWVVNDHQRCLPEHVWSDSELNELGFTEYQCGFENGWHPGMTDDPEKISAIIEAEYEEKDEEIDILYKLSYVSQFSLGFCVFIRVKSEEE